MMSEDIQKEGQQPEPEVTETEATQGAAQETVDDTPPAEEKQEDLLAKEKDRYLRLFAEFENYKKRTTKERIELFKTAGQDILSAMLPVLDDFDRALTELAKLTDEQTLKGVELIYNKLMSTLKSKGLEQVEVAANDVFDSEHHDAVTQIPAPTPEAKGKIVDVIQKGYKLGDKVIRFPKVVVAQ